MFFEILLYLLGAVVTVGIALIVYARWNYGELEKLGIPVVKPHWILGSSPDFYKVIHHNRDLEWFNTYGDVYGVYEGRKPQVHVNDPEIVKQIFIKDFDNFTEHVMPNLGNNKIFGELMDFLPGEKWKVVRSHMSPAFTTAKLKKMSFIMKDVSEEFVARLKKDVQDGKGVLENANISQDVFCALTDMVARCTLNIKIDNPRDPENDFAKAIRDLFTNFNLPVPLQPYQYSFPIVQTIGQKLFRKNDSQFFVDVFTSVMNGRRKSGVKQNDFIDFLLEHCEKTKTEEFKRLGITETTLLAQGVEFFIAGQEAMSSTIAFLVYYISLPKYKEVERKLYAEIDTYLEKHEGKISHETFGELVYLNACLYEVLRMRPSFVRLDRVAKADYEFKGLKVKKGMQVILPLWSYNRNPKYWPDPETFNPERFMPYNKDKLDRMAFGTFGGGPRGCPGRMFSFECMTILTAYLLANFRFKTRPENTEVKYYPGGVLFLMLEPLLVDIVERKKDN